MKTILLLRIKQPWFFLIIFPVKVKFWVSEATITIGRTYYWWLLVHCCIPVCRRASFFAHVRCHGKEYNHVNNGYRNFGGIFQKTGYILIMYDIDQIICTFFYLLTDVDVTRMKISSWKREVKYVFFIHKDLID